VSSNRSENNYFDGVRRAYALAFLLVMKAVDELGSDRGVQMLQEAVDRQAEIIENEIRRKIPAGSSPLESGVEAYKIFMGDAGAQLKIHERTKGSVTFLVGRCPLYEALLDIQVDCGYLQGELCTTMAIPAIRAILKRIDPKLEIESRMIKASAEEACLERIYLSDA